MSSCGDKITVDVLLEESDLQKARFVSVGKGWLIALSVLLLLIGVPPVYSFLSWSGVDKPTFIYGELFGGFFFGCFILFLAEMTITFLLFGSRRIRKHYESNKAIQLRTTYMFDAEGMESKNDNGNANYAWTDFYSYKELPEIFLIYLSDKSFIPIPKRFFTGGNVELDAAKKYFASIPVRNKNSFLKKIIIGVIIFFVASAIFFLVLGYMAARYH